MQEERTESKGFFEMLWDCEHCGTKGLLAKSQRHCANCGVEQNADKRYFPKEGEETRIDGHQFVGTDLKCTHCDTAQSSKGKNCTNCGAPLDGTATVKKVEVAKPPPPKKKWWVKWVVIGVIVLIAGLIFYKCRTKSATLAVTGHSWVTSIAIEQYSEIPHEVPQENIPAGRTAKACHTGPHPTKTVQDGESCRDEKKDNGDGTFEVVKKCTPIMKPAETQICTYTTEEWKQVEPVKMQGQGMEPKWPADKDLPPEAVQNVVNAKRRGAKSTIYELHFGKQTCEVSDATWRKYKDGDNVKLKVRASSGDIVCGDVQ